MRETLRQQVVDQLKRNYLANSTELFDHFKRLLGEQVFKENTYDIHELWKHQQTWTQQPHRDQRDYSIPPTPSTSSATNSNNWNSPGQSRRPLKIFPQCTDNGDPIQSPFCMPANGLFWHAMSKHHDSRGSYITSAVLSDAGVNFEEDGVIRLQWRPPGHTGPLCPTLFNIVSGEEAERIGMTDFNILRGDDFDHPVNQQYKAPREFVSAVPPRALTPPCRADSPAASTISVTRSELPETHPGLQNASSPEYSLSFKGGPYEFSMKAPRSDAQFLSFAKDVFQIGSSATTATAPTLNANPSPFLITGSVDPRSSIHMTHQGVDVQHRGSRTISQIGHADQAELEHRNKRKADGQPAPEERRQQRRLDINSMLN